MHQENQYLAALHEAERFEIDGPFLYIFAANRSQPLRFIGAGEQGSSKVDSACSSQSLAVLVLVATSVLSGGCRKADEAPSFERARETPAVLSTIASSSDLTGIWTVVGHHIPGISAMSDAEAAAWRGLTVRLTATEAISGGDHCDHPTYTTRKIVRDGFLAADFKLPPGSLTPLASRELLTLLEVLCGGAPWAAMGGRLIGIDANHALSPWNGVFFELARDRDFRAAGQEPFWRLEIAKGKELRFIEVSRAGVMTPVPMPRIDPETGARVYHAITEATDLRVVIEPVPCTDVMSGNLFETTVTVTLNGRTYHGCGGALP